MATLNHIGIAVSDPASLTRLFKLLGLDVAHSELVQEQGVRTHFLPLPVAGSSIELLEPQGPSSTVAQAMQKRGPGVHHLAFLVKKGELDELCQRLTGEGYRLIYDVPRRGAPQAGHEMRINFIHPASAGGVLVEIMEPV